MMGEERTYVRRKIVSKLYFIIKINAYVTISMITRGVDYSKNGYEYGYARTRTHFTGVFTLRVRP